MACYRRTAAPEDIEKEAWILAQEYLGQFGDDDEVPDNGIYEYQYAHASKKLKAYFDEMKKLRAEAERDGVMIG